MSCTGKYFRCLPTPNSIQSSDKEMYWNFATAMTTTSISTVRTITLVYPRLAAPTACSKSLVLASSCVQCRSAVSVLSSLKNTVLCLLDTTSPWSVPIVVSCLAMQRKSSCLFLSTVKKAVHSPGIPVSSLTDTFPLLLHSESFKAAGEISVPYHIHPLNIP